MNDEREFTTLKIRRKLLGGSSAASKYRVYRNPREFVTLDAHTASEACKASGIKRPVKIVRLSPSTMKLLDKSVMEAASEAVYETEPLEVEQVEGEDATPSRPIIIPAPKERGARILDELAMNVGAGGFSQVAFGNMGRQTIEEEQALADIARVIVAEEKEKHDQKSKS